MTHPAPTPQRPDPFGLDRDLARLEEAAQVRAELVQLVEFRREFRAGGAPAFLARLRTESDKALEAIEQRRADWRRFRDEAPAALRVTAARAGAFADQVRTTVAAVIEALGVKLPEQGPPSSSANAAGASRRQNIGEHR